MNEIRNDNPSATQLERGRKGARRTALLLAGIAVAVYLGFILMAALGK